jgi:hypothetical protein
MKKKSVFFVSVLCALMSFVFTGCKDEDENQLTVPTEVVTGVTFTDTDQVEGVIQNEAMMSPEGKMIYEIFGGRDTIVNNLMKQFDSDGDLLNANGVAGMDVTGKGTSWQKLTNVSEEYRQKMFDNVKKEFIQENGVSNGDTTKRSDIFDNYRNSIL